MSREHDIKDRHMRRVLSQPIKDPSTGEIRRPTTAEAEAQIARVIQRSEAEKREGRKPTQSKPAVPESLPEVEALGGGMIGKFDPSSGDEIRSRAGGTYSDRYELIDWKA